MAALISVTESCFATQTVFPLVVIPMGSFSRYRLAVMTRISAPVAALISVTELTPSLSAVGDPGPSARDGDRVRPVQLDTGGR